MGYSTQIITINEDEWINNKGVYNIYLKSDSKVLKEVKIVDSRLTEKQKENPLTVERKIRHIGIEGNSFNTIFMMD